jgi:hypothetical protein
MLSAVAVDDEIVEPPMWSSVVLPLPMPINAAALDEEAALKMLEWYPEDWHWLRFDPGIDLDAVKARARQEARWPHNFDV